jgi:hypothetical protein
MHTIRKIARLGTSNMHPWDENLTLFTPEEIDQLPEGTVLCSIMGDKKVKGKDEIDMDTRFGHTAWGVEDPWNHPLKDLFLIFKIKA